jgi:arsenate reductase (glutaredoxin)
MKATIYHNPRCGTSRNALALLEEAGAEVTVVEYLKTPPGRDELERLYARAGLTPREGLRAKEEAAAALGGASDEEILDAMMLNPILINRPLVETDKGVVLARPADKVRDIL